MTETRFNILWRSDPQQAEAYLARAQQEVLQRYRHYEQLAGLSWQSESGDADIPGESASPPDSEDTTHD
jgi:hypothetical protein